MGGGGEEIRLIVGFQPLMVISPTASWIRWWVQVYACMYNFWIFPNGQVSCPNMPILKNGLYLGNGCPYGGKKSSISTPWGRKSVPVYCAVSQKTNGQVSCPNMSILKNGLYLGNGGLFYAKMACILEIPHADLEFACKFCFLVLSVSANS